MKNLRNSKGFTLIELMIVVVIIGILAAIAIPKFTSVSEGAKQAEAEPILKQLCTLAEAYELRYGSFPTGAADAAKGAGADDPLLTASGWSDPGAQYYGTWTLAADEAKASKTGKASSTMKTPSMKCSTKVITWS